LAKFGYIKQAVVTCLLMVSTSMTLHDLETRK